MSLEALYPRVTGAIMDAEALDARGDPKAKRAHLEVSRLEEQVAALLPACDIEGALARSSAVGAAIAAGDLVRAERLAELYLQEPRASEVLREDLQEMLAKAGLSAARAVSEVAIPNHIAKLIETASKIFPVVAGPDHRLLAAPQDIAPSADPVAMRREYLDMRRAFADFAVAVSARASRGGVSEPLVLQALTLLQATPDGLDHCVALTLDRALFSACRALEIDALVNGASVEDRNALQAYYARLPSLFPQLVLFRQQKEFDRVEASSTGAALRTPVLDALSRVARTDEVIGQNLSVDLDTDIFALARAPLEPDARETTEQIRVRTRENSVLVQTVKSAAFKLASIAAQNSPLKTSLTRELAALPGLWLAPKTTTPKSI